MHSSRALFLLSLSCAFASGCQQERGLSEEQVAAKENLDVVAPHFVDPPKIDDANLVLRSCGAPASDEILPIYDKLNNGPVRRIVYRARRTLTFDFIPSHPRPRVTTADAPFPQPASVPLTLPADSVWRFDEARTTEDEMLTTNRMSVILPCAAKALHKEY